MTDMRDDKWVNVGYCVNKSNRVLYITGYRRPENDYQPVGDEKEIDLFVGPFRPNISNPGIFKELCVYKRGIKYVNTSGHPIERIHIPEGVEVLQCISREKDPEVIHIPRSLKKLICNNTTRVVGLDRAEDLEAYMVDPFEEDPEYFHVISSAPSL